MTGRRRRIAALATTCVVLGVASLAQAELVEHGDLFIRFSGGIEPNALPRHDRAPIAVRMTGVIKTLSGERPPSVRRIAIALNRGGKIDSRGLPLCDRRQIEPSSSQEALERCRAALVGTGSYVADIAFPEQDEFRSRGRILAFNAIVDGQKAVLAHVYGDDPVPITRIIVFRINETGGTFGTVLSGTLPRSLIRWGYLKSISLDFRRTYQYLGKRRSYISAACSAPAGFPGATFPFARASMGFEDGRTLSSTLTRSCKVRDA
jgi:hypothetical protein